MHGPRVLRAEAVLRARGVPHGELPWMRGHRPRIVNRGEVRVGSHLRVDGLQTPAEFGATRGASLIIGDYVRIARGAVVLARHHIEIGDRVRIGEHAAVLDSNIHRIEEGDEPKSAPVVIDDNVWLGRNSIVLPGVEIGAHSVVAAGAVVTESVPPRTLVAGVPARPIRALEASPAWRRT